MTAQTPVSEIVRRRLLGPPIGSAGDLDPERARGARLARTPVSGSPGHRDPTVGRAVASDGSTRLSAHAHVVPPESEAAMSYPPGTGSITPDRRHTRARAG